tara:strand:+ start:91 stop:771 length:681 start_codon:yes stop_codon:yes gene_type:complete
MQTRNATAPSLGSTLGRNLRAGFTLIELLAVMLIIGILMTFLLPKASAAIERARVTACRANLQKIGTGLVSYQAQYDRWPRRGGVGFFSALVYEKVWDQSEADSETMSCPSIDSNYLTPALEGIPMEEWYAERDRIDGGYSAYAGRDIKNHPLRKKNLDSNVILVADDNDGGANHKTSTNVLYGNFGARTIEFMNEVDAGNVTEEDEFIRVGPDSPIEALRVLTLN